MKFIKIICILPILFVGILQAEVPFSYTTYNVSDLYSDALIYIADKDYDKAIEKLLICKNSKRCVNLLSDIYKLDNTDVKDINKSVYYQKLLFTLGEKKAYHNIGFIYYKNDDIENAKQYFKKSYEVGVYESLFNLGKIYEKENNFSKAIILYKKASEQNISQADYALGLYYYKKKDINRTMHYFEKASEQGFKPAEKAFKELKNYININKIEY